MPGPPLTPRCGFCFAERSHTDGCPLVEFDAMLAEMVDQLSDLVGQITTLALALRDVRAARDHLVERMEQIDNRAD